MLWGFSLTQLSPLAPSIWDMHDAHDVRVLLLVIINWISGASLQNLLSLARSFLKRNEAARSSHVTITYVRILKGWAQKQWFLSSLFVCFVNSWYCININTNKLSTGGCDAVDWVSLHSTVSVSQSHSQCDIALCRSHNHYPIQKYIIVYFCPIQYAVGMKM